MMNNTITRSDLGKAVYQAVGLSQSESTQLVEQVLDEISNELVSGEIVKISSFGTLAVRKKSERIGRNPKTGEEVPITPRRVLTFRPSNVLKDQIDQGVKSRA
jgi:integration host factor subunit alpha